MTRVAGEFPKVYIPSFIAIGGFFLKDSIFDRFTYMDLAAHSHLGRDH